MAMRELQLALPLDAIRKYAQTQPINRLYVFGSFARGEQTPESDVDFLIEVRPDSKFSLLELSRMYRELSQLLGRSVDIATPPMIGKYIHDSVYKDLVLIYEAHS
jgi:predicted nucleotidyltransferase